MANTYAWDFPLLDAAPTEGSLADIVKVIHYRFIATSDQKKPDGDPYTVHAHGTVSLGSASSDGFIAFDSITKDQCKAWTLAGLDKTEAEMKTLTDEQMTNLITPPVVGKLPSGW
tara:strand:+ start:568 stop:912 length:345 start_codon:yes stop_codon:yes gene_type:complete